MSFLTEKKEERERQAIEAAEKRRYADARRYAAEVARYGFDLAEQSEGAVARAYVDDANEWLKLAERLSGRSNMDGTVSASSDPNSESVNPESPWIVSGRPKERFADVAGLDEVKKIVFDDVINPAKYPDAFKRLQLESGGGVLMYGPPGTGKTMIARAIAGELDATFFSVSAATIRDKYVGETEKNMKLLFDEARKCERAVVFIDEVHSLLSRSEDGKGNAIDQFLVMTDGFEKNENTLLLIGATNYPWLIDEAALRRFKKRVRVDLPDKAARRRIFELKFKGAACAEPLEYNFYAEQTDGYSGADIAEIVKGAKLAAIDRINLDDPAQRAEVAVRQNDVEDSIKRAKRTVGSDLLRKYDDWERGYGES